MPIAFTVARKVTPPSQGGQSIARLRPSIRLMSVPEVITAKDHVVIHLDEKVKQRWTDLFLKSDWSAGKLPDYSSCSARRASRARSDQTSTKGHRSPIASTCAPRAPWTRPVARPLHVRASSDE
ncbi:MAG TPA: fatty acid cis/trans isomerase [Labilithrix sp.]|nr:fatty acid cis/trans isomerase [Labilithrix sp.]